MKNVYRIIFCFCDEIYLIYTRMLTVTDGQKVGTIFLIPYIFLILKYVPT